MKNSGCRILVFRALEVLIASGMKRIGVNRGVCLKGWLGICKASG